MGHQTHFCGLLVIVYTANVLTTTIASRLNAATNQQPDELRKGEDAQQFLSEASQINSSEEKKLHAGTGSLSAWLHSVDGLEEWERHLGTSFGNQGGYIFTTTESELARARFALGLMSLHNFNHDLALHEFDKAQEAERNETGEVYPMALWGSAVSRMKLLWYYSDCKLGESYLKKMPDPLPDRLTELERDMINTAFELYPTRFENCVQEDTHYKRESRFAKALAVLAKKHPLQVEVQIFNIVGRLAMLEHPPIKADDEKWKLEMNQTRETLLQLYKTYPNHTGVMHFIIHAFDYSEDVFKEGATRFVKNMEIPPVDEQTHPAHTAIQVARQYLEMGKSAVENGVPTALCHGLHMPSHLFIRFGNWKESSIANHVSIQACDDLAQVRGLNHKFDGANYYHSMEFLEYDYSQMGQYEKGYEEVARLRNVVLRRSENSHELSYSDKLKELLAIESYRRSDARQAFEPYRARRNLLSSPRNVRCPDFGSSFNHLPPKSFIKDPRLYPGSLGYAAIAEAGELLKTGLSLSKECAESHCRSCKESPLFDKVKQNFKDLINKTSVSSNGLEVMNHIFLGMVDMAELIRPYGFKCYETHDCEWLAQPDSFEKIQSAVLGGEFNTSLGFDGEIDKNDWQIPTLFYMPIQEIYGHVLLFLNLPETALEMFEKSLIKKAARAHSLVGLARSHGMLGNMKKADFFYEYLRIQMADSDPGNLFVEEANAWLNAPNGLQFNLTRQLWRWPYL